MKYKIGDKLIDDSDRLIVTIYDIVGDSYYYYWSHWDKDERYDDNSGHNCSEFEEMFDSLRHLTPLERLL